MMLLELNGVKIKSPTSFSKSRYNLTKAGRVANGDITIELIAKKRKFFFVYDTISSIEKEKILNVIDGPIFFQIRYEEDNIIKSATVYVGEISQDRFRTRDSVNNIWYWRNFTFNLIER